MTTPIETKLMEEMAKCSLEQPPFSPTSTSSPFLCPQPFSHVTIPDPPSPSPGEEPKWTLYGIYLHELAAYNATGITIPQDIAEDKICELLLQSSSSKSTVTSVTTSSSSSLTATVAKATPSQPGCRSVKVTSSASTLKSSSLSASPSTQVTPKKPSVHKSLRKQSARWKRADVRHQKKLTAEKTNTKVESIMYKEKEELCDPEPTSERTEKASGKTQISATYNANETKTTGDSGTLQTSHRLTRSTTSNSVKLAVATLKSRSSSSSSSILTVATKKSPPQTTNKNRRAQKKLYYEHEQRKAMGDFKKVKSREEIERKRAIRTASYHRRKLLKSKEQKERKLAIDRASYHRRKLLKSKEQKEKRLAIGRASYHRRQRLQSKQEKERKLVLRRAVYHKRKENGQLKPLTDKQKERNKALKRIRVAAQRQKKLENVSP